MGFWDSSQTTQASSDVKPMERPNEFAAMFNAFMSDYLGEPGYKEELQTAYDEEADTRQSFLDSTSGAYGEQSQLLTDIINKQMSGEAVGPYGRDIDRLLGERTGVSFGGGDPMQFITGPQQRLLDSLLGSQRQGLADITGMAGQRTAADIAPSQAELALFEPSNQSQISYLQDLWDKILPMESLRYGFPSQTQSSTTTGTPSAAGKINTVGNLLDLGTDLYDWFI